MAEGWEPQASAVNRSFVFRCFLLSVVLAFFCSASPSFSLVFFVISLALSLFFFLSLSLSLSLSLPLPRSETRNPNPWLKSHTLLFARPPHVRSFRRKPHLLKLLPGSLQKDPCRYLELPGRSLEDPCRSLKRGGLQRRRIE